MYVKIGVPLNDDTRPGLVNGEWGEQRYELLTNTGIAAECIG